MAEPLIEYFEGRKAERFSIEDIEKDEFDDADLENIPKSNVKVTIKDFDKPIHLSKSLLQRAKKILRNRQILTSGFIKITFLLINR